MLFALQSSQIFLGIILILGILTASTDLWQKKIYNIHLIIGTGLGLIGAWHALLIDPKIIVPHLANGCLAFLIGWLLYHLKIWRGGDAKLFGLYAFLMPPPGQGAIPFSSVFFLFACSFIIATIIIMPIFIKDIILNYGSIAKNIWARRDAIFQGATTSIFFSWIIFPIYYIAEVTSPIIILTISYFMFIWGYHYDGKEVQKHYMINFLKKKYIELSSGILFGFLIRLWLAPNSLSWAILIHSILKIGIFTTVSVCIYTALEHLKEYRERVPFAPLLFVGCVLSYTSFLTWVMRLINPIHQ